MTLVRALAATDYYHAGLANPVLRTAMFEGQVYDIPEDEAVRLRDAGKVEVITEAPAVEENAAPPRRRGRPRKDS